MGSFIPFALTKAERIASSDPRLSLEERYGTHSRYVELVRQASERLVAERLLLQEDADAFIKLAEECDLGLPR
jgi:Alpha/beta hydrolase domain